MPYLFLKEGGEGRLAWGREGEGKGKKDSLPLIRVPVIGRRIDAFPTISREQFVVVVHAHATAHDFAHAGHETIDAFGDTGISGVLAHVKGLDLNGEVGEEDGPVDDVGHLAFGGLGDVVTELVRLPGLVEDVMLAQPDDGVGVFHA